MIDVPNKGEVLVKEVPPFVLLQLYKIYHSQTLPTELYFDDQPAIDLYSGDGQLQSTEEYKHIAEWVGMNIKEFRLERMHPIGEMTNSYLWNSRIPDVEFDKTEHKQLLSGGWPSLFWHADTYQPENRIKMIIYLNNVNKESGAVCMEEDLTYKVSLSLCQSLMMQKTSRDPVIIFIHFPLKNGAIFYLQDLILVLIFKK